MPDLFIDTAALIALASQRDGHHAAAGSFFRGLPPGQVFHLSNYIVDETLTRLRARTGHQVTLEFLRDLRASRAYRIHQVTEDVQEDALEIFEQQGPRGGLSFTDCTTVALMRRLELTDIFTFDRGFAALGLTVRP